MKLILAVAVLVLSSCGSSESTPNDRAQNPYLTGEKEENYYSEFTQLNGEPFPTSKLPSVLEDGKMIDICKKGQMFHNDICFDEVRYTEHPGFVLLKDGAEVIEINAIDLKPEFLDTLPETKPVRGDADSTTRKQRITTAGCSPGNFITCSAPTFWGTNHWLVNLFFPGSITTTSIGSTEIANSLSVVTMFSFPSFSIRETSPDSYGRETTDKAGIWDLKGSFTLQGQKLDFPITRKDIQNIVGPDKSTDLIETENGRIRLSYNNWDSRSPNPSDFKLIIIGYE